MSENEGQNELGRRKKQYNTELKMKGFDLVQKETIIQVLGYKEEGSREYQARKAKLRVCFMNFKVVHSPSKNPEKFVVQDAKNISRY